MTRVIATSERVSAAADALSAEGHEPSVPLIIKRIGGSHTTVAPHLRAWIARRDELALLALPKVLEARGSAFMRELYDLALREARSTVTEPLKRAEADLKSAQSQLADAEAEIARLVSVEEGQADQIARLQQRIGELERSLAAQEAKTQEKGLAMARLAEQLEQSQRALAESASEVAVLRASSKTTEALQGVVESLQRSVQGLTASKAG